MGSAGGPPEVLTGRAKRWKEKREERGGRKEEKKEEEEREEANVKREGGEKAFGRSRTQFDDQETGSRPPDLPIDGLLVTYFHQR